MLKNKKGFTLIELLVVIAIIALLATLAIISLTTAQRKARDTKRLADVKSIQSGVELYYSDNADYPDSTTLALFQADMASYMQIPNPPNDASTYKYGVNGAGDHYVVSATLEDTGHEALNNSFSGDLAAYTGITWTNTGVAGAAFPNPLTCGGSGIYCVTD